MNRIDNLRLEIARLGEELGYGAPQKGYIDKLLLVKAAVQFKKLKRLRQPPEEPQSIRHINLLIRQLRERVSRSKNPENPKFSSLKGRICERFFQCYSLICWFLSSKIRSDYQNFGIDSYNGSIMREWRQLRFPAR